MTREERDQFTNLCSRVLESQRDDRAFYECAEELLEFLDAVLPFEDPKAECVNRYQI